MARPHGPLTAHGHAALLPAHGGVGGVAPGPRGTAIRVAAEVLEQAGAGVAALVHSGKRQRSAGGWAQDTLSAHTSPDSLRPMWVAAAPELALYA